MKKIALLGLTLLSAACLAAEDQPATLSIAGSVHQTESCSVSLSRTTADLGSQKMELLPSVATSPVNTTSSVLVVASVTGAGCKDYTNSDNYYAHTALRFTGVADSTESTVLANTLTDDTAAKGIAVGLYTSEGVRFNINENTPLNDGRFPFFIGMVKVNDNPSAGKVQSSLTVSVEHL
ncbi:fimbrial protein [Cronobacter dublinensis]